MEQLSDYVHHLYRDPDLRQLFLELTRRCNEHCYHCGSSCEAHSPEAELILEEYRRILDEVKEDFDLQRVFLCITGGEPLLREDFFEIYSGLKRMGLAVTINSNGYLIKDNLLKQLIKDPPFRVNITLYGVSNQTYHDICGVPAYDTVIRNIKALRNAGIHVKLNLTLTPENAGDLQQIRQKAAELDVHLQTAPYLFPPVRVTGNTDFPQRMPAKQAGEIEADFLRSKLSQTGIASLVEQVQEDQADEACVNCRAGRSTFWLCWDGAMIPCGMMPFPKEDVLSLGFRTAWQNLRDTVKTLQIPLQCQQCSKRSVCHICLAKCYSETLGFEKAPAYPCQMTDAVISALNNSL